MTHRSSSRAALLATTRGVCIGPLTNKGCRTNGIGRVGHLWDVGLDSCVCSPGQTRPRLVTPSTSNRRSGHGVFRRGREVSLWVRPSPGRPEHTQSRNRVERLAGAIDGGVVAELSPSAQTVWAGRGPRQRCAPTRQTWCPHRIAEPWPRAASEIPSEAPGADACISTGRGGPDPPLS